MVKPVRRLWRKEPVLSLLGSATVVVDAGLLASNAVGWTHLDGGQLGAVVGFVTVTAGALAAAVRSQVSPKRRRSR